MHLFINSVYQRLYTRSDIDSIPLERVKRLHIYIFVAWGLVAAPPVLAKESTPVPIGWPQIVAAVDAHPLFKQHQRETAAAKAAVAEAKAIPNPTAEVTLARGHSDADNATALEWGVALTIPLDWMVTRNRQGATAQAEYETQVMKKTQLKQEILAAVRVLFWQLVHAQEQVRCLEQLYEQTQALTQTIQKQVESGDARPTELTRVEVELARVAVELEGARWTAKTQSAELSAWLGIDKPLCAEASLQPKPEPIVPSQLAHGLLEHPEIKVANLNVAVAKAKVRQEKKARFPALAVSLFAENELDKTAIGGGIEIDVPLWNFNRGAIEKADAEVAVQQSSLEVIRQRLERKLGAAQNRCTGSTLQSTQFKQEVVPRVLEVAEKLERAYALGEATLLEVIDARRTVLETQTQLLEVQLQARLNCSEVKALLTEDAL